MTSLADRGAGLTGARWKADPGSRKATSEHTTQQILDAAAVLQIRRAEVAAQLAGTGCTGAEILAVGEEINPFLWGQRQWLEILATHPGHTSESLRIQLPINRAYVLDDVDRHVVSVYDHDGTEPDARQVLANETVGEIRFAVAPIQMKIVDRRLVVLEGPPVAGKRSIMGVTARQCLDAAWRYWEAVLASSVLASEVAHRREGLTARQQQVVELLGQDLGDEAIAATLGVSVRTVRSDVAAVLDQLGARSRFAAGLRLRA